MLQNNFLYNFAQAISVTCTEIYTVNSVQHINICAKFIANRITFEIAIVRQIERLTERQIYIQVESQNILVFIGRPHWRFAHNKKCIFKNCKLCKELIYKNLFKRNTSMDAKTQKTVNKRQNARFTYLKLSKTERTVISLKKMRLKTCVNNCSK